MTFSQIPSQETLDDMLKEIGSEKLLKEDKQKIFKNNIFRDRELDYNFMPSIEEIVELATRKNLHFLVVYLAIMYLEVNRKFKCLDCNKKFGRRDQLQAHKTNEHGTGKEIQENRTQSTSKYLVVHANLLMQFLFTVSSLLIRCLNKRSFYVSNLSTQQRICTQKTTGSNQLE